MSEVIPFVNQAQVDAAWAAYGALAHKMVAQPSLLADRPHMEEFNRAHERWKRLFLRMEEVSHGNRA